MQMNWPFFSTRTGWRSATKNAIVEFGIGRNGTWCLDCESTQLYDRTGCPDFSRNVMKLRPGKFGSRIFIVNTTPSSSSYVVGPASGDGGYLFTEGKMIMRRCGLNI